MACSTVRYPLLRNSVSYNRLNHPCQKPFNFNVKRFMSLKILVDRSNLHTGCYIKPKLLPFRSFFTNFPMIQLVATLRNLSTSPT